MKDFNPLEVLLLYVVTGSPRCKGTHGTSGTLHQGKNLFPEQSPGDPNPLFRLVIDLTTPQLHKTSRTALSKALHTT